MEDVLANFFLLQIAFINDDLPTLDLPMKAYSGKLFFGHISTSVLLIIKRLDLTCMFFQKFLASSQFSKIVLNFCGCSIIGACPHLSIQYKFELGSSS